MGKKYVIEGARITCEYGQESCLKIAADRHIEAGGKFFGNQTDYTKDCVEGGGFKFCRSPHVSKEISQVYHDSIKNIQQLDACGGGAECEYTPVFQWLQTKDDVIIAFYQALLEDSWTICGVGLGIVSFLDSGQVEDPVQKLQEQLSQLDKILKDYMSTHGISEKNKNKLINSVLLWNGYLDSAIEWDYKSTKEARDFCRYLSETNPSLFNYFERGIYMKDPVTAVNIDVGYMAGISSVLNRKGKFSRTMINQQVLEDEGIYNGYLEACRIGASDNAMDAMNKFLEDISHEDYDGNARYFDYLRYEQSIRDAFTPCNYGDPEYTGNAINPEETAETWGQLSEEEQDLEILKYFLNLDNNEETTNAFINKLHQSVGKGNP